MRTLADRPDVGAVMAGLKDFQRATVEHVHRRFFDSDEPARRMLVADEVGLGKTLVARGVIAKAIDALWDTVDRIDVIYVCSNAQIAAQNVNRLQIPGAGRLEHVDRLTMLPGQIGRLDERKVNFVSFTPGTSFDMGNRSGRAGERAVLWHLLAHAWSPSLLWRVGALEILRGSQREDRFRAQLKWAARPEPVITQRFTELIATKDADRPGEPGLRDRFETLVDEGRSPRRRAESSFQNRKLALLGEARNLVARACIDALEPDLVILDEFQRFRHLLGGDTPATELTRLLFDYRPTDPTVGQGVRTLLLSATPFKMYTLPDEPEGDDHYADFLHTVGFLADDQARVARVRERLADMRRALHGDGGLDLALTAKADVEQELRRFMVRTERLAGARDGGTMLAEQSSDGLRLDSKDLEDYVALARTGEALAELQPGTTVWGPGSMLEYWRSAPYVLNFMEGYQVKDRFVQAAEKHPRQLIQALRESALLPGDKVTAYERIPFANPKLRALREDVLARGSHAVLWIPPSLPYQPLTGPYAKPQVATTKRLVFSAWNVVPKTVSVLLTYEAERLSLGSRTQLNYDDRTTVSSPLRLPASGRATGMATLMLAYPFVTLARLGDPLAVAREQGWTLPVPRASLERVVADRIAAAVAPLTVGAPDAGRHDERWYWAAPMLLDRAYPRLTADAFRPGDDPDDGEPESRGLVRHLAEAANVDPRALGRPPEDMIATLTRLALHGPGVCALRALSRVTGAGSVDQPEIRVAAARIGWGFRSLFSRPESVAIVRDNPSRGGAYWRKVLDHAAAGCLQAVLDEHVHVLPESLGVSMASPAEKADAIADQVVEALTLRAARVNVDDIRIVGRRIRIDTLPMRQLFASRFGDGRTEAESAVQRGRRIQAAFNSPFWPFVLVSTSVGQEGLDFHWWCHAVVHWNLPHNPVDLEQREGRVHRYKGHAVRRNLALAYGTDPAVLAAEDPWQALFDLGHDRRGAADDDLVPYWVFTVDGGAVIERHVPVIPLSREEKRLADLKRTLGAYRLTIGQPRQEDLLAYLGQRYSPEQIAEMSELLRIDLRPQPSDTPSPVSPTSSRHFTGARDHE